MATQEQLKDYFIEQTMILAAEQYPTNPELRAAYMAGVLAAHLATAAYVDSHVLDRFRHYVHTLGMTTPVNNRSSQGKE